MEQQKLENLRTAAQCHKQVTSKVKNMLKPNTKYIDICEVAEAEIKSFFTQDNLQHGLAFPVGISVNNIAAHDSANPNDTRTLKKGDIVKIDCGVHVNGHIIDSAFTYAIENTKYDKLIEATREGTYTGIKLAGADARINDISAGIQEVIESYDVKPISNLCGHNIKPYIIHGGKFVSSVKSTNPESEIMEAGECFAIETFASTGMGFVVTDSTIPCNHYMKNPEAPFTNLKLNNSKRLLSHINKYKTTLPFSSRWLNDTFGSSYRFGLNDLVNNSLILDYPALTDKKGSYTSQLEHTIYIHENKVEILSQNDLY
jgi:methionyl aminopeptidase